jgi:regulator of RNase E activity RraB
MIPKSELVEMFAAIAEQTDWDMSSEMLWGYFFTDDDRGKLEACAERLTELGYEFVEIADGDEPDDPLTLQVEKIEIHSPDSLYERNLELTKLAEEMGIHSYDGMDVGTINGDDDFDEEYDDEEDDE